MERQSCCAVITAKLLQELTAVDLINAARIYFSQSQEVCCVTTGNILVISLHAASSVESCAIQIKSPAVTMWYNLTAPCLECTDHIDMTTVILSLLNMTICKLTFYQYHRKRNIRNRHCNSQLVTNCRHRQFTVMNVQCIILHFQNIYIFLLCHRESYHPWEHIQAIYALCAKSFSVCC